MASIASTLSNARKCSNGKYKELRHFSSKVDAFPDYVKEVRPKLAAKTSYLQTGYFTKAWKLAQGNYLGKVSAAYHIPSQSFGGGKEGREKIDCFGRCPTDPAK